MTDIISNNNSEVTVSNLPLVSIIVITYNSAKYILETLESIKLQNYKNIELIISDDGSKDETIAICNKWVLEHNSRFVNTIVLTVVDNLGIPANCNRGVNSSNGKWVKIIAGDDLLDARCITNFIKFSNENSDAKIIDSVSHFFKNTFSTENLFRVHNMGNEIFFDKKATSRQQHNMLLRRNYLHAASTFLNREAILEVGGFEEKFKFMEDYPMWLKLTNAGFKVYYLNEITVFYRLHESSIYSSINKKKLYNDFYKKLISFDLEYIYPKISSIERFFRHVEFLRKRSFDIIGMNKNTFLFKLIFYGTYLINPNTWITSLQIKRIEREIKKS